MAKTNAKDQGNKGKQKFIQISDALIIMLFCLGMLLFILVTWQKSQDVANPETFIDSVSGFITDLDGGEVPEQAQKDYGMEIEEKLDSKAYMNRDGDDLSKNVISGKNAYVNPGMKIVIPPPGEETIPVTELKVDPKGSSEGRINIYWTPAKNESCHHYQIRWWRMSSFKDKDFKDPDVRAIITISTDLSEGEDLVDANKTKYTINDVTPNEEYLIEVRSLTKDKDPCTYQEDEENAYVFDVISPGDEKEMPQPRNFRVDKATLAGIELRWDAIARVHERDKHPDIDKVKVAIYKWKEGEEDKKIFINPPDDANPFGTMVNHYEDMSIEPDVPYNYGVQYYHLESYPDWDNKEVNYLYDELLEIRIQDVHKNTKNPKFKENKPVFVVKKVFASKVYKLENPIVLKDRPVVRATSIQGKSNPDSSLAYAKIELTVYQNLPVPEKPSESKFVRVKVEMDVKVGDMLKGSTTKPKAIDGEEFSRNSRYGKLLREKNITIDFETSLKVIGIYNIEYKYAKGNTDTVMYVELKNMDSEFEDCWTFKVYRFRDIEDANEAREAEANAPTVDEEGNPIEKEELRKQALVPNKPEDRQCGPNKEERKDLLKTIIKFADDHGQDSSWYKDKTFKFTRDFEDLLWEFLIENEVRFYTNAFLDGFPILREFDQLRELVNEFNPH